MLRRQIGVEMGTSATWLLETPCQVIFGTKEMPSPARMNSRTVSFQRDPRRESGGVAVHISDGPEALAGLEKNEARFGEVLQLH